jgi:hypothetical protein
VLEQSVPQISLRLVLLGAALKCTRHCDTKLSPPREWRSAFPEAPVWGILMETGYSEATATLLALGDGTTSLYLSSGGGHRRLCPSGRIILGRCSEGATPRNEAELLGLVSTDSHARLAQVVNEPDEA